MRKNIPTELLFEIIDAIPFDRKLAQIHVSQVFNHFLFNRISSWLSQIKNLTAKCTFLVRSIVKMIRSLPDNLLNSHPMPMKVHEARSVLNAVVLFVLLGRNYPQNIRELFGLPLNPNHTKLIQLKIVVGIVSVCCNSANITVEDLCLLEKFLSDYAFHIINKYVRTHFGGYSRHQNQRHRHHWVNKVLLSAIEIVSYCGICANTTADELRSIRISLCCHVLKRLHESQYIFFYDF